jgi:hypothetical protein
MSAIYRILREEYRNGNVNFKIEKKVEHVERWVHITNRDTVILARAVIEKLIGDELVSSEVVE